MAPFRDAACKRPKQIEAEFWQELRARAKTARRKNAFEYCGDTAGRNTRLDYQLSDDHVTLRTSVILSGRIGPEDAADIERILCGTWWKACFEPESLILPDLTEQVPNTAALTGRQHHHITRISFCDKKADGRLPTADQFVALATSPPSWLPGRVMTGFAR
jgi:hypothetical protein